MITLTQITLTKLRKALSVALLASSAFSLQPSAFSQVTPTTIIQLTNIPTTLNGSPTGNTVTNFFYPGNTNLPGPTQPINLRQGTGMAALASATTGANGAEGFSITWAVTPDGTNWSTLPLLQLTNNTVASSTNNFVTNYPGATLNNFTQIAPASMEWAAGNGTNLSGIKVVVGLGNIVPGGFGN